MDSRIVKDIYVVAAPSICQQTILALLNTFMNGILISFSTTAVAILGIQQRLGSFLAMPVIGISQGVLPIFGYNFGAQNKKRLLYAYKSGILSSVAIMTVGVILFLLIPSKLLLLFSATEEMMEMGVHAFRILCLSFIPSAILIITAALYQALAQAFFAMTTTIVRQLGFLLPLALILGHFFGLTVVWIAVPLAEFLALILSMCFLVVVRKKVIGKIPDEPPAR
jgi:Na+-driven multidrug efflux pump